MADEQDKWLDRDAAERLLRGEPLEGVDPHARVQADRLAQALGALAATDRPDAPGEGAASAELPGEAAALAAFRAARAAGSDSAEAGHRSAAYATSAHEAAAAETVRRSRAADRPRPSRWGRPVRLGLAAALAGCMVGGVAVAAGTGVLPSPFGRHDGPSPAASASPVASTPEEPRVSPSDEARQPSEELLPDDTTAPDDGPTREPRTHTPPEAEAGGDHSDGATRLPGDEGTPGADGGKNWYRRVVAACRDHRSGALQGEKRRRLEEAAKGHSRVEEFCGRVLGGSGGGGQQGNGGGQGGRNGGGQGGRNGGGNGGGGDENNGDGDGENGSGGEGDGSSGGDTGGAPVPPPALPAPTPTGSYSALPALR
ncbi:hypothetical protein [Streptomyces sp. NPDC003032]